MKVKLNKLIGVRIQSLSSLFFIITLIILLNSCASQHKTKPFNFPDDSCIIIKKENLKVMVKPVIEASLNKKIFNTIFFIIGKTTYFFNVVGRCHLFSNFQDKVSSNLREFSQIRQAIPLIDELFRR